MTLHFNPFYKSRFSKKNDSFFLRMQRAFQNFSGTPTANDNLHGRTPEERQREAVLGIFDYVTFCIPAGIDKFWLILKKFIVDNREEYPGFLFGCLKCLAVLAAIPTFLANTLLNIGRFLFGFIGMLVTFPIAAVATLAEFEGRETKKQNHPKNIDTRLDDPYFNPNDSSNMQELFNNKDGSVNNPTIIKNNTQPNPTKSNSWNKTSFVPDNDEQFNSPSTSNYSH